MRKLLLLIALLGCLAAVVVACSSKFTAMQAGSQDVPKESKTQPKEVVLGKDSQSDKYGEVPFNHENHATKNYSIDGKSVLSCVECHHTDQPATALVAPLKTSERDIALTAKFWRPLTRSRSKGAALVTCKRATTAPLFRPLPIPAKPRRRN